jgi:hypothetical protein
MLSNYQEVKDLKVVPLLIDGTRSTTTGRTFPPFSNALQRELFLVESANPTSATAAAKAVSKDFKTWKHTLTTRYIFAHSQHPQASRGRLEGDDACRNELHGFLRCFPDRIRHILYPRDCIWDCLNGWRSF